MNAPYVRGIWGRVQIKGMDVSRSLLPARPLARPVRRSGRRRRGVRHHARPGRLARRPLGVEFRRRVVRGHRAVGRVDAHGPLALQGLRPPPRVVGRRLRARARRGRPCILQNALFSARWPGSAPPSPQLIEWRPRLHEYSTCLSEYRRRTPRGTRCCGILRRTPGGRGRGPRARARASARSRAPPPRQELAGAIFVCGAFSTVAAPRVSRAATAQMWYS